jgi:uncharacterized protein YoxC
MTFIIIAIVIASLALVFSVFALIVFAVFGKRVFKVFSEMTKELQLVNTNFSGIISQNNNEHDHFRRTLRDHGEMLNKQKEMINEHEDILRPRKIINTRIDGSAKGRD